MKRVIYIAIIVAIQYSTLGVQHSVAQTSNDNRGSGNCLDFDGINDLVGSIGSLSSYSFIQNTGVFTLECWLQFDASAAGEGDNMILANTPTSNEKGFYFDLLVSGGQTFLNMRMFRAAGASISIIHSLSPANIIPDANWHHVACVGDGTNVTFYVDGFSFAGTGTMGTFSTGNSSRTLMIGDDHTAAFGAPCGTPCFFDGQLDDVRIWNTTRTQTQLRDNMCQQLVGSESGLVGYWNMNDGTGNTVADKTSNANHGTRQ